MEKAKPFDEYFNDLNLGEERLERMILTRKLVHEIYPDVQERVSYAMPGFYPKNAKKATQQLFLLMANKEHLGVYGTQGLEEKDIAQYNLETGKGSIKVPYNMPERDFKQLLEFVINYNANRHGQDLM
ncbi:MAG: hypothetical protein FWF42_02210 [Streptococcaceae bacterium]|nr:hypothetical protein [Streptococcaceae bacterium]